MYIFWERCRLKQCYFSAKVCHCILLVSLYTCNNVIYIYIYIYSILDCLSNLGYSIIRRYTNSVYYLLLLIHII